ncbi:hypothetical protein GGP85_000584 [Salinibacter ruber]|uniref:hypothetical protein n=1 Tax=Salinibacter ruber TaxID=146919 RepID=UPI00216A57F5|nr:hypothetical protein [Salinibacter ruber]MCS3627840.1 hypothetical protein [Salinibacter ruber]MCS3665912.1 hypothetical protein [Salinibacter ruber]MCS3825153.1 hypothetical protein [Salinibacter ruber]MCS4144749.1 hypothetical protein [Salinibacter ruber]
MPRSIQQAKWKRASADSYTDITDAVDEGVLAATPHPDDAIDRPKGYSVRLTLAPDSTALADALQDALLDMDPARMTLHLEGVDEPISALPVSVSKVPHLDTQNTAELGVPSEGHDQLHPHF